MTNIEISPLEQEYKDAPHSSGDEQPFSPAEYSLCTSDGTGDSRQTEWTVKVCPHGEMITRDVMRDRVAWEKCGMEWEPEGVIWPSWPARPQDQMAASAAPLASVQSYWDKTGSRLRDSAKWMAAVLGAALATLIGSSPLTGMRDRHPQAIAIILGSAGLVFLFGTLFLVLQVMRPQSVSFADVQSARPRRPHIPASPLYKWQHSLHAEQDLYLPCGVKSLTSLRQAMIIEEVTLAALARAKATARDDPASQKLCDAQTARSARLLELRTAAATIATVGEYYKLRNRSTWATYGGVTLGLIGTAAVVAAFAWPPA